MTASGRLVNGSGQIRAALAGLLGVGIDLKQVTDQLEKEGVDKFQQSFDALLKGIVDKRAAMLARA